MVATVVMNKQAAPMNSSPSSSNKCSSFGQPTTPLLDALLAKSDAANPTGSSSNINTQTQRMLPYVRHALSLSPEAETTTVAAAVNKLIAQVAPPPPPTVLAAAGLSMEQWNVFAAKAQPIIEQLQLLEKCYWSVIPTAMFIVILQSCDSSFFPLCLSYPFVMFGIILLFANVVYEVMRLKFWKALMRSAEAMVRRDSCHFVDSSTDDSGGGRSSRGSLGTNLDCMYEWVERHVATKTQGVAMHIRGKGFYLYFFPSPAFAEQEKSTSTHFPSATAPDREESSRPYDLHPKGYYLRFPIAWCHRFVNPLACQPEHLPQIPCYQSLPAAFRHGLDEDSWSRFALDWQVASSKYMASQSCLTMHLRICLALWLALFILTLFNPFPVWMYIVVSISFVVMVVLLQAALEHKIGVFRQWLPKVKAFNDTALVNQGLYLEHRCVAELGRYYGLREVRYLYLIRMSTSTVN